MAIDGILRRKKPTPVHHEPTSTQEPVAAAVAAPAALDSIAESGHLGGTDHTAEVERTHSEIMVVMGALMLTLLLAALDQSIVGTALPTIAADLHGFDKVSLVASSYLIASAIVTPIYGKLGDLFGRKKIFQISIIIFLIGSALAGLSQNMAQLIAFRALQGLGGGGLMALVLAIIGDVIPPRQRGRYQGYFGAVFGLATVAGPLLGGYFTQHLSWRWCFYINLPLGIAALAVVATYLHLPKSRLQHKIDYAGAALLSVAVSALLLITIWAGKTYAWGSAQIIGLGIFATVTTLAFIVREHYAIEPIIPLKLFKNDIFNVSAILSFLAGVAMFAAVLYIPIYQQTVRGDSPTASGLLMLPLVVGLFGASLISGRLTSKTGKYRAFPIIGTLILAFGLFLFSHLAIDTSQVILSLWMLVLGAGLGLFMQIPTLAVQNSTERSMLGTATSTIVFFRSIGSALGAAVFGTILTSRLAYHLAQLLPAGSGPSVSASSLNSGTSALAHAPEFVRNAVFEAFVRSFHDLFLIGVPFALAAFVAALFLREQKLRGSAQDMAEGAAMEAGPAH